MTRRQVGSPKMWPLQTEAAKYLYERMRQAKEFGLAPDLELWQNALRDVEIEAAGGSPAVGTANGVTPGASK